MLKANGHIPVTVSSFSCVGVKDEFPRGSGNYITITDYENKNIYHIVNLSYEDLQDLIDMRYIDMTMNAYILPCEKDGEFLAYIIDDKIPPKCLTPFWLYGIDIETTVTFIRNYFDVPSNICICDYKESRRWALSDVGSSRTARRFLCKECRTNTTVYYNKFNNIDINPEYFVGTRKFIGINDRDEHISVTGSFKPNTNFKQYNPTSFEWHTTEVLKSWHYVPYKNLIPEDIT